MRALVGTVLVLLLPAPAATAAELGFVTDLTWGISRADKALTYATLGDLRARWGRISANWAEVERRRGSRNGWSLGQIDDAVRRNRAAGRRVVVSVYAAPRWASGSSYQYTPPRRGRDYARFVGFLARRYRGLGVAGYEIWNEPNLSRFWGWRRPSARRYVKLLRAASRAVRAYDPAAQVVFGGLSTGDTAYVRSAYAAGARNRFDVMGLHPYTCEADISARPAGRPGAFLAYRDVRAVQTRRADPTPMWFTEFGWATTTGPCGVSALEQSERLETAAALMAQDAYVQAAMWYSHRDRFGDLYGVLTATWRPKPAYATFKRLAGGGS